MTKTPLLLGLIVVAIIVAVIFVGPMLSVLYTGPPAERTIIADMQVSAMTIQFKYVRCSPACSFDTVWSWDFGDGQKGSGPLSALPTTHLYTAEGDYRIRLAVDDGGKTGEILIDVRVPSWT